jgi:hypothetical protein
MNELLRMRLELLNNRCPIANIKRSTSRSVRRLCILSGLPNIVLHLLIV